MDLRTDIPSAADAKRMYKACMNESLIEQKASQPALDVLQVLNHKLLSHCASLSLFQQMLHVQQYIPWPVIQTPAESEAFLSTFDWAERTALLRRDGGSYLISLGVCFTN